MKAGQPAMALFTGLGAVAALCLAASPQRMIELHPMAASAILGSLALAALAVTGALLQHAPASESLGLGRGTLSGFRTAALALGTIGLGQLLNLLLAMLELRGDSVLAEIDRTVADATGPELALFFVALAVAPGLAEELLFRGLILRGARAIYGSRIALLSSSLLFGLVHLDEAQGAAAMCLGLYLGAIALKGGSIRACIACHMANNAAALMLADAEWAPTGPGLALCAGMSALGLIALFAPVRREAR